MSMKLNLQWAMLNYVIYELFTKQVRIKRREVAASHSGWIRVTAIFFYAFAVTTVTRTKSGGIFISEMGYSK